jgi:hypothetical protein
MKQQRAPKIPSLADKAKRLTPVFVPREPLATAVL